MIILLLTELNHLHPSSSNLEPFPFSYLFQVSNSSMARICWLLLALTVAPTCGHALEACAPGVLHVGEPLVNDDWLVVL